MTFQTTFYMAPDVTHEMETTICVNARGQGRELAPEESLESEMYANPPNSRGGITVTPTPAWGLGCPGRFLCFGF